jgi:hypothetical protein
MSSTSSLSELLDDPTVRVSICCACGNARSVSANHYPRGRYTSAPDSPERIARMQQHGKPGGYWSDREPWRGGLELLKCSACAEITEHAMTGRPGRGRDPMDEQNYPEAQKPETSDERALRLLTERVQAIGVSVVYIRCPAGGTVEAVEWEGPVKRGDRRGVRFEICIEERLVTAARIAALRWGWRHLAEWNHDAEWFKVRDDLPRQRGVHRLPDGAKQ